MTKQRGFTIIELMVVVAIIGILSALAAPLLNRGRSIGEVGRKVAAQLREASRLARTRGPVRPDVAQATGMVARSHVIVQIDTQGVASVWTEIVVERALPTAQFDWVTVSHIVLPHDITIAGVRDSVETTPGTTPSRVLAPGDTDEVLCNTNGMCDPRTYYLQTTKGPARRLRVALMPLSGGPLVLQNW